MIVFHICFQVACNNLIQYVWCQRFIRLNLVRIQEGMDIFVSQHLVVLGVRDKFQRRRELQYFHIDIELQTNWTDGLEHF